MAAGTQMGEKESDQARDTEITLSTGKLLGIFFALAIVCGVFFTMGYLLGKSTSAGGRTEIVSSGPSGSPAVKPTAGNKQPETITQTCPPGSPNCASATTSDTSSAGKAADQQSAAQSSSNKASDQPASQPAGTDVKNGANSSFMVQVAAVSKQEDAEILVTALRKKQYPVFIANSAGDPLFHVQVGPFSEKKDAEAMRTRLSGDGYNAIVK
ncbi:MAG TPA: SPOR domain-containing protein [Candidatus Angelobacter sp.]|nr:SPOR domain-containing protein [Candidatus Angelobacter sp.]